MYSQKTIKTQTISAVTRQIQYMSYIKVHFPVTQFLCPKMHNKLI